jgi:hypothetical protein
MIRVQLILVVGSMLVLGCEQGSNTVFDFDGDGVEDAEDCEPEIAVVYPGNVDRHGDGVDSDCDACGPDAPDGAGDGVDRDCDGYPRNVELAGDPLYDCDDTDAAIHPDADDEVGDLVDRNCDGSDGVDLDGDGYASSASGGIDCYDADAAIHPGAAEVCGDSVDNDCNGVLDDVDIDSDGYVDVACGGNDCDDLEVLVHPGRPEVCDDGVDNDCSGADGDADEDFDGFVDEGCGGDDCDDLDPFVSPAALETCNGLDDNCDGVIDDRDLDLDGHLDEACGGDDCDDTDPYTFPGATEWVNATDDDCDGVVDDGTVACDDDLDGYTELDGDCDDANDQVNPGAAEQCNAGVDDDCDPATDDFTDTDGDGYAICDGDCDDAVVTTFPGAQELCDGVDNDCDGTVDMGCAACDIAVPADQATVQDAIDAALAGQRICVGPGIYLERVDFGGLDVEVVSTDGAPTTILDGGGTGPVVTFESGESRAAVLQGFTITGGSAARGGGVYVSASSPVLRDLVVDGCEASTLGGGLFVEDSAGLFEGITAQGGMAFDDGGGLAVLGSASAEFRDLVLLSNQAENGGGLYMLDSSATVEGLWIESNSATMTGAGVNLVGGAPTLVDAVILGGDTWFGGGLCTSSTAPLLQNVEFFDNDAWYGGAVYESAGSTTTYDNVRFVGNTGSQGAGLFVDDYADARLTHCVLAGNVASNSGGGASLSGSSSLQLVDSVLVLNESSGGGGVMVSGASADLENCDVWGNTPDDFAGMADPTGSQGNVSLDPLFLDTAAADPWDWDLHLQAGSSLVDGGGSGTDPDGSPSDMGAYGGPNAGAWDLDLDGYPEWWQPGPYDALTYPASGWDCDDGDPTVHPGSGC